VRGFAKHWTSELGDVRALDLTTERLAAVMEEWAKRLKPASINRHLAALRHAFKVCKLTTLVDPIDLDWSDVWQTEPEPRDQTVPVAVFRRIHERMPEHMMDLLEIAFFTSIRRRQLAL